MGIGAPKYHPSKDKVMMGKTTALYWSSVTAKLFACMLGICSVVSDFPVLVAQYNFPEGAVNSVRAIFIGLQPR